MAALTVLSPALTGTTVTYAAASAGGDTIPAQAGGTYDLHVKNGSGGALTVTLDDPTSTAPVSAVAFNPDVTVSVAAGAESIIRFNADRFRDPTTGNVSVTYSGVTTLTVAVVRAK